MKLPQPWSTQAVNLPDHADNLIHTDDGARAAGFERALVAGTTVYAYLTHPAVEAWGLGWLGNGGGELRLRKPVFDRDRVDCVVGRRDNAPLITAEVGGDARATLELWNDVEPPDVRPGTALPTLRTTLGQAELDYGERAGDDLALYRERQLAHPVTWANLANQVFKDNLVTGPWIHVRSRIFHESVAPIGAEVHIDANVVKRFDSRAGERALVDMRIHADGRPVATIEHEAIITIATGAS